MEDQKEDQTTAEVAVPEWYCHVPDGILYKDAPGMVPMWCPLVFAFFAGLILG